VNETYTISGGQSTSSANLVSTYGAGLWIAPPSPASQFVNASASGSGSTTFTATSGSLTGVLTAGTTYAWGSTATARPLSDGNGVFSIGNAVLTLSPVTTPAFGLYAANYYGANPITSFDATGNPTVLTTTNALSGPSGIAFDKAGNLYVADQDNTIHEFSSTGADLGIFASTGLSHPFAIAFDSAGNLYAANSDGNTIHEFSPTGADLGTFASTGIDSPFGLAFDRSGNLYVANSGNNTIHEFSPSGTNLGTFASAGLNEPNALAFDATGNLYAINQGDGTIHKFSPTGADLGTFANPGIIGYGLAFDAKGNLYESDQENKIHEFSPTGADLGVFASNGLNNPEGLAFAPGQGGLPLPNMVPEPASFVLVAVGAVSLLLSVRAKPRQVGSPKSPA
jgi:sugar lactone lactonase YvrE